jgi:hypothetical protein
MTFRVYSRGLNEKRKFTRRRGDLPFLLGVRGADATCGNGHDTLLLARLVGPGGKIWVSSQLNRPASVPYVVLIEKVRT